MTDYGGTVQEEKKGQRLVGTIFYPKSHVWNSKVEFYSNETRQKVLACNQADS